MEQGPVWEADGLSASHKVLLPFTVTKLFTRSLSAVALFRLRSFQGARLSLLPFASFRKMALFNGEGSLHPPHPPLICKLKVRPLLAVSNCLFNILADALCIGRPCLLTSYADFKMKSQLRKISHNSPSVSEAM